MFDAISLSRSAPPPLQRAIGEIRIAVRNRDGRSVLSVLHQQGSAKARLPAVASDRAPEVVLLNTAGGLASGDRFSYEIAAGDDTSVTVTTAACERVYRSLGDVPAGVETRLEAGPCATLEWLPQETILFDRAAIRRRLSVDMAADSTVLIAESVILGRAAHGETVDYGSFRDDWRLRRAGRLVFAEATRLEGPIAAIRGRKAVLDHGTGFATLLLAGASAASRLDPLRALLSDEANAGASLRDGVLLVRIVAADGMALRRLLVPAISILRGGVALPRVWQC